ncbi:serine hydrolase [Glycomyces luteolus]|uniref:Serine hydrolase n=1 Tax=Glycomyces luteolus TaxID=2670330 RepID=A0A9X3SRN2_9ACTN|nr:serine hydrolase domain-containing protein [Glycomyces luteolus]MDA1358648.1 serine hydrolase [Glycomyces luteolus]
MRKHKIPAAVAALGLVGVLGAAEAAAAHPSRSEAGDIDTALLEAKFADFAALAGGSVLAEVRDGDDTWTGAAGLRSLDEGADPAEPDDRVRIGSTTKSMTAAIVLQLAGEGELDLDDPIGGHLPGLLPYEEDPTIRQLLQHTSGVPDLLPALYPGLGHGDFTDLYAGYRTHYEPEELIAIGTEQPLQFKPGTDWAYSNTGYMVLGLLIEERTGDSLRHAFEERIFEPAGLDDTYFPRDDTSGIRGPHAVPYVTTGDPDRPYFDTTKLSNTQLWAGGGVISTVGDLNAFYDALADGTLLAPALFADATDFIGTGGSMDYGLGMFALKPGCAEDPGAVFFGHEGDGLGHQTQSFHSLDGERRITLAWSIDDKAGYGDEDAFDAALTDLMQAGLCG